LKFGRAALSVLLFLIAFDVIGVVVSSVLDITPVRGKSALAFYAIWFVLGVFCGMLSYNSAAGTLSGPKQPGSPDWSNRPDSGIYGGRALAIIFCLVSAFSVASYLLMWRSGVEGEFFVPDNEALSLTFFGAIVASAVVAHSAFRPSTQS
jgi:hypothetical protein